MKMSVSYNISDWIATLNRCARAQGVDAAKLLESLPAADLMRIKGLSPYAAAAELWVMSEGGMIGA
jgi:hypothetical protein